MDGAACGIILQSNGISMRQCRFDRRAHCRRFVCEVLRQRALATASIALAASKSAIAADQFALRCDRNGPATAYGAIGISVNT